MKVIVLSSSNTEIKCLSRNRKCFCERLSMTYLKYFHISFSTLYLYRITLYAKCEKLLSTQPSVLNNNLTYKLD